RWIGYKSPIEVPRIVQRLKLVPMKSVFPVCGCVQRDACQREQEQHNQISLRVLICRLFHLSDSLRTTRSLSEFSTALLTEIFHYHARITLTSRAFRICPGGKHQIGFCYKISAPTYA